MYDMLIRKKALKIQERLGMRIGVTYGTTKIPVVKKVDQVMKVLYELYKVGLRAFVLPKDMFDGISSQTDLYKVHYGNLLKIRDTAKKYNIELSLHHPDLPSEPDQVLKTFASIASVMDCRIFSVNPSFYSKMMPPEQALRLAVHKINEITNELRSKVKIGIETTGKIREVGSVEDVIEIVKRTRHTEPVMNWGNIHARGSGALRSQKDFSNVTNKIRQELGREWMKTAFFFFSGVSYGPSGLIKNVPLKQSDINLEFLIREIMSLDIKGTLIFEDPQKEKFILKMLEDLADMVR